MFRKHYSLSRKLAVAMGLALVTISGVAIADDASTNRFGGDGYAYFDQPTHGAAAQYRAYQASDRELQAASSSSLAAAAFQIDYPSAVFANAAADPSWRLSHPNGLTERELEAASSSALAMSQLPVSAGVVNAVTNVAQASSRQRR